MKWENKADASNLLLTRDSSSIIIGNSGNYFLYARVKFNLQKDEDFRRYVLHPVCFFID